MNVKRYIGKTNSEVMQKVKRELGSEAVILHTRKIKQKGLRGLFSKPLVEIVAASDGQRSDQLKVNQFGNELLRQMQVTQRELAQPPSTAGDLVSLQNQMSELTDIVRSAVDQLGELHTAQPSAASSAQRDNDYLNALYAHDVDGDIIARLEKLSQGQINFANSDGAQQKKVLAHLMRELLKAPFKIEDLPAGRNIMYFIGPTGVGKTTTIAKIAARLSLIENKRVSLVTADTFRIAAVDQLKTYSEIMSIPLDVVYEPADLVDVLTKRQDVDYLLIDTAGRNHKSDDMQVDLKALIDKTPQATIFLVLSLTSSRRDIESILNSYRFIEDYKLIFTKLDEAEVYGNLLNASVLHDKALAYLTDGQSVPDDIKQIDEDSVVTILLGDLDE